jgi:hypothetical protein
MITVFDEDQVRSVLNMEDLIPAMETALNRHAPPGYFRRS